MNHPLKPYLTWKQTKDQVDEVMDWVLVEEPLQITVVGPNHQLELGVFLRTPGADRALVCGLLRTSGLIKDGQIPRIELASSHGTCGHARVSLDEDDALASRANRLSLVHAGCGWCGSDLTEWACDQFEANKGPCQIANPTLFQAFAAFGQQQQMFQQSGGSHAAGLCDAQGNLHGFAEDVGRHNAVDKVIGRNLLEPRISFRDSILLLSGRAGFELVYKAAMVAIPIVASLGAPSSSSIELAREAGLTLISFVKDNRLNVYTHRQRFINS